MKTGIFTISLDFELHWGVSDSKTVDDYRENLDHTREAIRKMLDLFRTFEIHATWAIVGFLFCKDKNEIESYVSKMALPKYINQKLSNYDHLPQIGNDHIDDPYHFGNDMIPIIKSCPYQEIGTHTFSHYYCLERGQTTESFSDDINAALSVAQSQNISLSSIVFPRNQYSSTHLEICRQKRLKVFRGNSFHWLYRSLPAKDQHLLRRAGRLLDSYFNISGKNTYELPDPLNNGLYNVPASRFLRPYHSKLKLTEGLRLSRIKKEMNYAAKHNRLYHLWWHPHNFGKELDKNIGFLKNILDHYKQLNNQFSFTSLNMNEVSLFHKK